MSHQKIVELIDWTLEKYKMNMEKRQQQNEQIIINDIIQELDKKMDIVIYKKKRAMLKDEVSMYRLEEDTIDYILFRIRELIGKLV
jgi:3-dehydroquinate dehydratase